jgi:CMP-N,N'-diacetyllegionaminic acid synthase
LPQKWLTWLNMAVVISLIPARGGSKVIPKKNIVSLAGKPLISHSIEYSLGCSLVERTIVSTDDPEIAEVARNYGAEVPFVRPSEFAQDDTPDLPVFYHALDWLRQNEGFSPDLVVQLRPTTPIRPPGLIDRAIQMMITNDQADCVRSVREPAYSPYKMWKKEDGYLKPFIQLKGGESYNLPRQKLPEVFYHDGLLDVIRASTILEKRSISGNKILPLSTDDSFLVVDIDNPVDFVLAETFLKHNQKS